jgi:predicted nucleic acid-binding protein
MNARRFVDTNILLYAISTAAEERSKAEIALALLESDDLALSVQVLQEFYVQATRPAKPDRISHEQASALIESWLRFPVQETTVGLMQVAMQSRQKYPLSYWDASIIEAARMLDCRMVISEDLSHGAEYGGIVVLNPFRISAIDS